MTRWLVIAAILLELSGAELARAEQAPPAMAIGYVDLVNDARYGMERGYAGIEDRTKGRALPGAEVGIKDASDIGRFVGIAFELVQTRGDDVPALAARIRAWVQERQVHFVIADLPAAELVALADAVADQPVLLFNVSAPDDELRQEGCRSNVAHTYPSDAMLMDALVQHLVAKNWRELLVLVGPAPDDAKLAGALSRSVAKFGAEIVEERRFVLGDDPRQRDANNVALLTAEADYDVVFVADASGEFAPLVPYQTAPPRPVVGSAGLTPLAWHWTWARHGAPQLQHRFEAAALPRRMNGQAWAAWVAVKAVVQAVLRADSADFAAVRGYVLGDRIDLDGVKGSAMSFRAWDQQLRQPILLATADAVIERAPLPEFLHQTNALDTLGSDAPESRCVLQR
jgi:ABC transporter substrate binding protein (PQQ-dependent alcohol dehydrogenase system)